ncbi:hypothetical protein [Paenibacillus lautus]
MDNPQSLDINKLLETLDHIGQSANSIEMQELAKALAYSIRAGEFRARE